MVLPLTAPSASFLDDLRYADFGDVRLTRRLGSIAHAFATSSPSSLPDAMGDGAAVEGAYRFVNNGRVTADDILAPHHAGTATRAGEHDLVLLVHDTTQCDYTGEVRRKGLGRTTGKSQGFFAHVTLAVAPGSTPTPLGTLALTTYTRPDEKKAKPDRKNSGRNGEFIRWEEQALLAEEQVPRPTRVVHVMDREADAYALMASLSAFVIRATSDRVVYSPDDPDGIPLGKLRDAAQSATTVVTRTVRLSRRRAKGRAKVSLKEHPPRDERVARLAISSMTLLLRRNKDMPKDLPTTMPVNVVVVREIDPPPGCEPVEWLLLTKLPVDTAADLETVVDYYRCRWTIEELFKALKTGLGLESLQLESYDALVNTLGVMLPVAVQLLALRTIARAEPDAPASRALSPRRIKVLRAATRGKLPARPTVRDALFAIAGLGGHLRHNGAPGWLTLARGLRDLEMLELGWALREEM